MLLLTHAGLKVVNGVPEELELENDLLIFKSTYYNVNPQFKVYINKKIKHRTVSLYIHIFEHSYYSSLDTVLWCVYIATEGPPQKIKVLT